VFDNLVRRPQGLRHIGNVSLLFASNASIPQGLRKVVPDQPKDSVPVHLRPKQIYAHIPPRGDPFVPPEEGQAARQ